MASKTSWHRCGTKLRHSHPVYTAAASVYQFRRDPKPRRVFPGFYRFVESMWKCSSCFAGLYRSISTYLLTTITDADFKARILQSISRKPSISIHRRIGCIALGPTRCSPWTYADRLTMIVLSDEILQKNETTQVHLFCLSYDTIRYDTIRDAILTCARKPT